MVPNLRVVAALVIAYIGLYLLALGFAYLVLAVA